MFNGISIFEYRLLAQSIIFTLLFLVLTVTLAFLLYASLKMKSPKERQRIKKLKEKAASDELAKKQLEKIERRNKRRRKRNKKDIVADTVIWCLSICFAVAILALCVIPGWTDYIVKDYIVYTGEITVYNQWNRSRIELDDGTTIWGRGDFAEEDTYGTVIYSRRTKLFIGGSN